MRNRESGRESGMVTAETALVIPVLVVLALILAWVVSLGIAQVRLVDAARETARMSARGDSDTRAKDLAQRIAPEGSTIEIDESGDTTDVRAELTIHADLPLIGDLGSVDLSAESSSASEGPSQ